MDEYIPKLDLRKLYQSIGTEELRALRDDITQELKARNASRDYSKSKPVYSFWLGKVVRRRGNALCRFSFLLEPVDEDKLPQEILPLVSSTYFRLMSGSFKKATCPMIGDVVMLKYRVLKSASLDTCYRRSRIICVVPPKLAE